MIKMKKLNVVLEVPTEEKASILEKQGFERVGGEPALRLTALPPRKTCRKLPMPSMRI